MRRLFKRPDLSSIPSNKPNEGYAWEIAGEAIAVIRQLSKYASAGDAESLETLKWLAKLSSDELLNYARTGRQEAVQVALEVVSSSVKEFETCCKKLPANTVRSIARKTYRWPGFYYCHGEKQKKQNKTIGNIELGRGTGFNYEGRSFSLETPGTRIAFDLKLILDQLRGTTNRPIGLSLLHRRGVKPRTTVERKREANEICEKARKLPDLNKATYSQWWLVAKRLLAFQYGESFEDHDYFKGFRQDKVIQSKGEDLERWFLRDFISKKIQRGFSAIARKTKLAP